MHLILVILICLSHHVLLMDFELPLECELGKDCVIQYYPDVGFGTTIQDTKCSRLTYDGHKGTDFRVVNPQDDSMRVLAPQKGVVTAIRNNAPDHFGKKNVGVTNSTACGNGLIIQHDNGFTTQYCHLKQWSIPLRVNDVVNKGDFLGLVGYSGKTNFLHLHFSVRQYNKIVDPFTGKSAHLGCGHSTAGSLWSKSFMADYQYGMPIIYDSGFSNKRPIKSIHSSTPLPKLSDLQFYWVKMIGLKRNDLIKATIYGDNKILKTYQSNLEKPWRHYFFYVGYEHPTQDWYQSSYYATIEIIRSNQIVDKKTIYLKVKP